MVDAMVNKEGHPIMHGKGMPVLDAIRWYYDKNRQSDSWPDV